MEAKMKKRYLFADICILCIIFHVQSFAETIVLEEIIVRGEREVSPEECLDIREVRETPARDVGEALKVIEGISAVRKGAIANDIVLRGFQRDNINTVALQKLHETRLIAIHHGQIRIYAEHIHVDPVTTDTFG